MSPIRAWNENNRGREQYSDSKGTSETTCNKIYATDGNHQERHAPKVPDFSAVGESGNSRINFSSYLC